MIEYICPHDISGVSEPKSGNNLLERALLEPKLKDNQAKGIVSRYARSNWCMDYQMT